MANVYSEQTIIITRSQLDGGIKGVKEWEVYRKKIGEAYALIDTYNLVTEGHYVPPNDLVEGSVGEYNFAYSTDIPASSVGDQYQYKIISNDRADIAIERESEIYEVILSIHPSSISSTEVFGNHQLNLILFSAGLSSEEAFGTSAISSISIPIQPISITSLESFGVPELTFGIGVSGISSLEVFGTHTLSTLTSILPSSISSLESFGTQVISTGTVDITPNSINSLETFGTQIVTTSYSILQSSITSDEAFGLSTIDTFFTVYPESIISLESFGISVVYGLYSITPNSITSLESFGTSTLDFILYSNTITSEEAFGLSTITTGSVNIDTDSPIISLEAFGLVVIGVGAIDIDVDSSITSEENFGLSSISTGPVSIIPDSISSNEGFGSVSVVSNINVSGISSEETFGTATLSTLVNIQPTGILSSEFFGVLQITPESINISPNSISSEELFGVSELKINTQWINATSISSAEDFGSDLAINIVYCVQKPHLIRLISRVATVRERRAFKHLQAVYGLVTQVWFPVNEEYDAITREGSIYVPETAEYRYSSSPNLPCEVLVYTNIMDLSRFDTQTLMDNVNFESSIYAFIDRNGSDNMCLIPDHSKLNVEWANKDYQFFVERVNTLESPYSADGKAIHRLSLRPYI